MKKLLLLTFASILFISAQAQTECIEIFISEYVEGWSNNKAIEIYNPTNSPIDLINYRLDRFSNGNTSASDNQQLNLGGVIEPYSTYVIVIDKRDPLGEGQEAPVWDELQAKADTFLCANYNENNVMYFNGNDAMVLRNISGGGNGFVVDVVGRPGEDPALPDGSEGWNDVPPDFTYVSNGVISWTKDHSLIRKADVVIGDLTPTGIFNVSLEWDSIPPVYINDEGFLEGNWGTLGSHECLCNPTSVYELQSFDFLLFPNPSGSTEIVEIVSQKPIDRYEIMDITGKLIESKPMSNENTFQIALGSYSTGLYIIKAYSGNTYSTRKLIIR